MSVENCKIIPYAEFQEGMLLMDLYMGVTWKVIAKTPEGGILQVNVKGGSTMDVNPITCRMNFVEVPVV